MKIRYYIALLSLLVLFLQGCKMIEPVTEDSQIFGVPAYRTAIVFPEDYSTEGNTVFAGIYYPYTAGSKWFFYISDKAPLIEFLLGTFPKERGGLMIDTSVSNKLKIWHFTGGYTQINIEQDTPYALIEIKEDNIISVLDGNLSEEKILKVIKKGT